MPTNTLPRCSQATSLPAPKLNNEMIDARSQPTVFYLFYHPSFECCH